MPDTIQNLHFHGNAHFADATQELNSRLNDRMELPLSGLHGEKLYLTNATALQERAAALQTMYEEMPIYRAVTDMIQLEAWSSAAIDGAKATFDLTNTMKANLKDSNERVVSNIVSALNYSYRTHITAQNIRKLWVRIVDGVCGNNASMGAQYRDGMIYTDSFYRLNHVPATPDQLPGLMDQLFSYLNFDIGNALIRSFVAHFYIIYLQPFCDGNSRVARALAASHLYYSGYRNIKKLPISHAITKNMDDYQANLSASRTVIHDTEAWLDLSPFVSHMLDAFEYCLNDAKLSVNVFTNTEKDLLKMLQARGSGAETTASAASRALNISYSRASAALISLTKKGYLTVDNSHKINIYTLV